MCSIYLGAMVDYTAIDLFAGCGGASRGLRDAGFDVLAALELDEIAIKSYEANHRNTTTLTEDIARGSSQDILSAAGLAIGDCTVVVGCPPCQGFSTHRLRGAGDSDPRNQLIIRFAEIVLGINPQFFIFENVPRAGGESSPWQQARRKFEDAGYKVVEDFVDAADYGVPQRRKRFTAMGSRLDHVTLAFPPKTHRDPRSDSSLPEWQTVRRAISDLPSLANGERSATDSLHYAPRHSEASLKRFRAIPQGGGSRRSLPPDLVLPCHEEHNGHKDVYGRLWWNRLAGTITSGCTQPSKGRFLHPVQNRGLSLREAARLQAFPDDYVFLGTKQQVALQIGNAVPPPLARSFAVSIRRALRIAAQKALQESAAAS